MLIKLRQYLPNPPKYVEKNYFGNGAPVTPKYAREQFSIDDLSRTICSELITKLTLYPTSSLAMYSLMNMIVTVALTCILHPLETLESKLVRAPSDTTWTTDGRDYLFQEHGLILSEVEQIGGFKLLLYFYTILQDSY